MLVYNYDKNTKEYRFSNKAEKNPEESYKSGKFIPLVPAYATLVEPLIDKKGFAVVFNDDAWVYVEDHRGEKVINPETEEVVIIDYLGEIKEGFIDYETYINSEEYKKKQAEKERQRVANLTCTKRVFVLMLQELGLDYYEQILPELEKNKQAKLEWDLCVELLRSNPLIDIFGAKFKITKEQLDKLFKYANGEITINEFRGA